MELISRQAGRMTAEEAIATLKANYPDACYEQLREAVDTAIEALGKDINVPTKSALDHIHNVVAEREYQRGYEQGKADTAPKWIPISDRLPEEGQRCLVCDNGWFSIDTFVGHGNPYNWKLYVRDYEAWMPLPEPYKEE